MSGSRPFSDKFLPIHTSDGSVIYTVLHREFVCISEHKFLYI